MRPKDGFRQLWESPPLFNVLDKIKVGETVYEVVGVQVEHTYGDDGVVSLRPYDGSPFVKDTDDSDSDADYYRVPLSIIKAANPKVNQYQPPLFT